MRKGGVTLDSDMTKTAADYGRRCESIGTERRSPKSLDSAMSHPKFKERHHALLDDLEREYIASLPIIERPARFSVTLGAFKTKENMIKAVESQGHKISDYARSVIANNEFTMLETEEVYDFYETTVKELTGKNSIKTSELYAAMYGLGFIDAPHESACAIRLEYTDQPMNEWQAILSKPVADSGGHLRVLYVVRNSDGSWVYWRSARPDYVWIGFVRLLVCRKRQ